MMHVDNHLAEIQSDAGAINMHAARVIALIEAVEHMLEAIVVETYTRIHDTEADILVIVSEPNLHLTTLITILESIGKQIGEHLIELVTVYPYIELLTIRREYELNIALLGIELKHLTDALGIADNIGELTMQLHLLLVNLTHIKYLVD